MEAMGGSPTPQELDAVRGGRGRGRGSLGGEVACAGGPRSKALRAYIPLPQLLTASHNAPRLRAATISLWHIVTTCQAWCGPPKEDVPQLPLRSWPSCAARAVQRAAQQQRPFTPGTRHQSPSNPAFRTRDSVHMLLHKPIGRTGHV